MLKTTIKLATITIKTNNPMNKMLKITKIEQKNEKGLKRKI